jgi:tRNA(fMet)-specific endonuclease VapC
MVLLDTDTCIHFMKGRPGVLENFSRYRPGTVFLSSISYHELLSGALHSGAVQKHLEVVAAFIKPIQVLPFTLVSAGYSSQVRQALALAGQTMGPLDTLIAAHALEHELTLVTGNTREFARIGGLMLENWG